MNATHATINLYFDCWNEPNDEVRLALIERGWTSTARSVDPLADVTGHTAISEMMGAVQQQFPDHRFQQVGESSEHHDVLHWSWKLCDPTGNQVISGIDVAHLDADGKIANLAGFFDGATS
jgi:hypothetical protein